MIHLQMFQYNRINIDYMSVLLPSIQVLDGGMDGGQNSWKGLNKYPSPS